LHKIHLPGVSPGAAVSAGLHHADFAGETIVLIRLVASAVLTMAAFAVAPAAAQTVVYNGASLPLTIPVTASVGGRCQFANTKAPGGTQDVGAVDTPTWSYDFPFTIECNTASRVAVVSTNGGLKTAGTISDAGYLGLAPYTVLLNLDGNTVDASAGCAVSTLTAAAGTPCSFRGPASSTAGLRLAGLSQSQPNSFVRVSAQSYTGTLVSGSYADTLIVTIAAAP
jgi:hypothetical protein